jgi:hypothetical protein
MVITPLSYAKDLQEELFDTEIDSSVLWMPYSSVDSQPGKVSITEYDTEGSYDFKLFGRLPVTISSELHVIDIHKTVVFDLPSRLIGFSNDIDATLPCFNLDKTYINLGVSPSFYADDWNFTGHSFRMPFWAVAEYLPDDKWTFLAGAYITPYYDLWAIPIAGFIYKPNDRLTFNIYTMDPSIIYKINDRLSVFAEGGYAIDNEFTVTRNNSTNVVLTYDYLYAGGGLKYKLGRSIACTLSAGGVFNRSLEYRDGAGKADIDKTLYVQLAINIAS